MKWVEIQTLKDGERVFIRRQPMTLEKVQRIGGAVILSGKSDDGTPASYRGCEGESIQKVTQQEVVYG